MTVALATTASNRPADRFWTWLRESDSRAAVRARRVASSTAGTYLAYLAYGLVHPHLLGTGTRSDRDDIQLPGDDLIAEPDWNRTFEGFVRASPAAVWPWLVQIGHGRAGWYTWYPLDNGGRPSAERIVPELQKLAVGDVIPDGPRADQGYGQWRVVRLEPSRVLVLHSRREPFSGREVPVGGPGEADAGAAGELSIEDTLEELHLETSWAIVLTPEAGGTLLTVRARAHLCCTRHRELAVRVASMVFAVGDLVMERSLLEGLRRRVEGGAA